MKKDFKVKDHSVTGEEFTLTYDENLHMYFTNPKPTLGSLPAYYESEDYISHTDGKRSLFEFAYQTVKTITLSRKHKLLKKYSPSKNKLLDIGSGTGDFLDFMSKKNWNVTGVEPSEKAKDQAKKKGLQLFSSIGELGEQQFDIITLWHVLEHIYDLEYQIAWIKKHLHHDGTVFIAVPNFESYDANYYKQFWAAYDVPRHLYHFSQKAINVLFTQEDLQIVETVPMKFDAFYVSLLSEKYKSGRHKFLSALKRGFASNRTARKNGQFSSLIYVIKHKKS